MTPPIMSARTLRPPKKIGIDFGRNSSPEEEREKVFIEAAPQKVEPEEDAGWGDWA